MPAQKTKNKPKPARRVMTPPAGAVINLQGLEHVTGFGDKMIAQGRRGQIGLQQTAGTSSSEAPATSSSARTDSSCVLARPICLGGVRLTGLPDEGTGVVVGGVRYGFDTVLLREGDTGLWSPFTGAPAVNQWYATDPEGRPAPPATVQQVFEPLLKVAELYYRSNYLDFVLAELVWYNNGIAVFEQLARLVTTKEANDQQAKAFYAARFSGNVAAMREAEQKILDWLKQQGKQDVLERLYE